MSTSPWRTDGRGLSIDGLRRAAVARGHLPAEEAARLGPDQSYRLLTLPGVSTATAITGVSGRGVGMDLVQATVDSLGGRLAIHSTPGCGTAMRISVPIALSMIEALLVQCRGGLYALPIAPLDRTVNLGSCTVERSAGGRFVVDPPERIELHGLADRLGIASGLGESEERWALVLRNARGAVALAVDDVVGCRTMVVRPLAPPLRSLRVYRGAAVLENGSVALVLDPLEITP